MRFVLAAALLAVAAPASADTTAGTVFAYDARTGVLVMEDHTIWHLGADTIRPETLDQGDKVVIDFTSTGDDGVASIQSVTMQSESGA